MDKIEKVMVISVRAGAGHIRAAQAVERKIRSLSPMVEVCHIDALSFTNPVFAKNFAASYENLAKSLPSVWGMIYNAFEDRFFEKNVKRASALFDSANVKPLLKEIKSFDPDVIVCTHYLPAEALAPLRRKGKLRASLNVIITDYDAHTIWLQEGIDRYFVATEEMAHALRNKASGSPEVIVSGIPVLDEFSASYPPPSEVRKKLGFCDRPTVLLSSGGFGLIPIHKIVRALSEKIPDVQVIAVAGKNAKLEKKLRDAAEDIGDRVVPFGFVSNMHELMAASDLLIAKPGGLTTSEALAMGLPMVVVKPIPGQEERNAVFLLEAGAGVWAHSPSLIVYKTGLIFNDSRRLSSMKVAARSAGKPDAAANIVSVILSLPVGAKCCEIN
jgi:processive 1,2-diacylglycerol beta-glucosyltransferase